MMMTQEIREGYKSTEIGVIPTSWELKKLKEIADVRDGTHESPKQLSEGIPFITSKNLKDGKLDFTELAYISEEDHLNFAKRSKVDNGDILFAMIGTIGNPIIVNVDFEFSIKNVALIKFNKTDISNIFVKLVLDSNIIKEQIKRNQAGGVQKFISLGLIRDTLIPYPPLQEQQRIAEILSTTDEHIEKLDGIIADYQLLKKGLMKKLLTEGIGHTEFKETEIGRIPAEWEVARISDIGVTSSGGTPNRSNPKYYDSGTIPWIKTGELKSKYLTQVEEHITDLAILNSSAKYIPINSILIAMYGATIGMLSILKIEATSNQACCAITVDDKKIFNEYLYYYLEYDKPNLISQGAGGAQPNISQQIIKSHKIALPPTREQKEIARTLSELDILVAHYKQQRTDFMEIKKSLMDNLLTGRKRVYQ
jgi:type I restriction enzyme S subunit